MSISSIGSTPIASTPLDGAGKSAATNSTTNGNESTSASSSSSASATTIASTVTETNADGSTTTITTYGDGSSTTSTTPAVPKSGPGGVGGLLDGRNAGQGNTLIAAQAQNSTGPAAAAT